MGLTPTSLGSLQLNASFSSFLSPKHNIFTSPHGHGFGCMCLQKTWKKPSSVFLTTKPVIKDGVLSINGTDALTGVPDNVVVTPLSNSSAAFVGATSTLPDSRHVFRLGLIQDSRLLCLFRFKLWWMIPRVGNSGRDIPIETQMILLEAKEEPDEPASYILFLPVLYGEFRSSLQGNPTNELELCVESGDPAIVTSESLKAVFVNYGDSPFDLMNKSMKILEKHLGTFSLRETKQMPGILDCFGWCTWDAFYHKVNPQGIRDGLKGLSEGGTPARFLIIDDGWQDTTNEFQKEGEPFIEGSQFGARLVSIKENNKFRETANNDLNEETSGLKDFVADIKRTFGLRYVYVWHALLGYWGGFHPDASEARKYKPELKFPLQSPGNLANKRDISMDCMEKYGIGAIDPAKASEFYNDLHGYLASQNVDGVKVDVQNILETLATGLGGRVSLTRHFQQALEKSIAANFQDNSIICCMGLSTDTLYKNLPVGSVALTCFSSQAITLLYDSYYSTRQSAITRASDDYYPTNPSTQSLHIAAVAFNSIFLGEFVVPDWDMFYSLHSEAEFHAIARAVGGCGVYVSDKPGQHDFEILRRLVLPDGSVLRAKYPGRPSRDCLFNDPVMDGKSLLKIWNLNKVTGVIGVFNCQGAGSWPCLDNPVQKDVSPMLSVQVSPADIEYFEEVAAPPWTGDCAVFSFKAGSLSQLPKKGSFDVKLKILDCDIFTVSPIKVYHGKVHFAAIGLIDMYNSGGAVETVEGFDHSDNGGISIKGRGAGRFGAYSNQKPKLCSVNSKQEAFTFNDQDNLLTIPIPSGTNFWEIVVSF